MGEPVQSTVDVVSSAATSLIEFGIVGAVAVLAMAVAGGMAFLWLRSVKRHNDFLEEHYRDIEN